MVRKGMHKEFWWESQKERDHQGEFDVSGRIIFKWILER
jgi:hypothetical protein